MTPQYCEEMVSSTTGAARKFSVAGKGEGEGANKKEA
jgi:hypothetical protein